MPASHHSVFYRPDALPVVRPTVSDHWKLGLRKSIRQSVKALKTDCHLESWKVLLSIAWHWKYFCLGVHGIYLPKRPRQLDWADKNYQTGSFLVQHSSVRCAAAGLVYQQRLYWFCGGSTRVNGALLFWPNTDTCINKQPPTTLIQTCLLCIESVLS